MGGGEDRPAVQWGDPAPDLTKNDQTWRAGARVSGPQVWKVVDYHLVRILRQQDWRAVHQAPDAPGRSDRLARLDRTASREASRPPPAAEGNNNAPWGGANTAGAASASVGSLGSSLHSSSHTHNNNDLAMEEFPPAYEGSALDGIEDDD
eukprot:1191639-Prorocentrum_minimum.AAC.2